VERVCGVLRKWTIELRKKTSFNSHVLSILVQVLLLVVVRISPLLSAANGQTMARRIEAVRPVHSSQRDRTQLQECTADFAAFL
jgi:hypothetical protein